MCRHVAIMVVCSFVLLLNHTITMCQIDHCRDCCVQLVLRFCNGACPKEEDYCGEVMLSSVMSFAVED